MPKSPDTSDDPRVASPPGDRFCFSPDIGRYVQRDGTIYTEYGEAFRPDPRYAFRSMPLGDVCPSDYKNYENYADWTDDHRAQVKRDVAAEHERHEREQAARRKARDVLVDQARAKLSPEEFQAVLDKGIALGRCDE